MWLKPVTFATCRRVHPRLRACWITISCSASAKRSCCSASVTLACASVSNWWVSLWWSMGNTVTDSYRIGVTDSYRIGVGSVAVTSKGLASGDG